MYCQEGLGFCCSTRKKMRFQQLNPLHDYHPPYNLSCEPLGGLIWEEEHHQGNTIQPFFCQPFICHYVINNYFQQPGVFCIYVQLTLNNFELLIMTRSLPPPHYTNTHTSVYLILIITDSIICHKNGIMKSSLDLPWFHIREKKGCIEDHVVCSVMILIGEIRRKGYGGKWFQWTNITLSCVTFFTVIKQRNNPIWSNLFCQNRKLLRFGRILTPQ